MTDEILTPEDEAQMIWKDRPIIRHFQCPIVDCEERLAVHGDVTIVVIPQDDGGFQFAFVPELWADAFEEHFALDHGASTSLTVVDTSIEDDEEDED